MSIRARKWERQVLVPFQSRGCDLSGLSVLLRCFCVFSLYVRWRRSLSRGGKTSLSRAGWRIRYFNTGEHVAGHDAGINHGSDKALFGITRGARYMVSGRKGARCVCRDAAALYGVRVS